MVSLQTPLCDFGLAAPDFNLPGVDGRRWTRAFSDTYIIPRGATDKFDAGSVITNGTPVVLE